jgi:hypothetical protein
MGWQVLPDYPIGTRGNACLVCNSDLRNIKLTKQKERALSTGIAIDFEGIVVICESCITEAADLIGMVPEAAVDRLRKNNRELVRRERQTAQELEQAKQTIRSLAFLFPEAIPVD